MAGDWLKLHRTLLDSPVMQHDGMLKLWIYCLISANWKPGKTLIYGTTTTIDVDRGEFVTGREVLHSTLYPKENAESPVSRTVWRWLSSLEAMGCVSVRTVSNRCSIVKVCNYDTYQSVDNDQCPAAVPPVSSSCPAAVPLLSTLNKEEEGKKGRREEGKKKDASLSVVIPESLQSEKFVTAWGQWQQFRREIKCPLTETQAAKQMEQFVKLGAARSVAMIDHTISKGWRGLRESEDAAKTAPPKRTGPRPLTDEELKHFRIRQTADEDE